MLHSPQAPPSGFPQPQQQQQAQQQQYPAQLVFFSPHPSTPPVLYPPVANLQPFPVPGHVFPSQQLEDPGPSGHNVQSRVHSLPPLISGHQSAQMVQQVTWRPAIPTALQVPIRAQNLAFKHLSNFARVTRLGEGTFGRVYLVRNTIDRQYYALKVLKKATVIKLRQIAHIVNERDLLSFVDSPWIIKLYCTFCDTNAVYLVTEYVIGGEMFNLLRSRVRLPLEMATFYAAEIVLALEYLHSRNIAYRDLKPENILITNKGHLKLCDFGFAKIVPHYTWTLCGTPEYLAPEVLNLAGHNTAADFWSLGVLIYEMLFGFPPFLAEQVNQLYDKIRDGRYSFPSNTYIDPAAQSLISHLLVKIPSLRIGYRHAGIGELKAHPFFRGVNWEAMARQAVPPPWVPQTRHEGDTRWFGDAAVDIVVPSPGRFSGDSPAIEQALTTERALAELPSTQERYAYEEAFRSFNSR